MVAPSIQRVYRVSLPCSAITMLGQAEASDIATLQCPLCESRFHKVLGMVELAPDAEQVCTADVATMTARSLAPSAVAATMRNSVMCCAAAC
jgi:hypothetical protein